MFILGTLLKLDSSTILIFESKFCDKAMTNKLRTDDVSRYQFSSIRRDLMFKKTRFPVALPESVFSLAGKASCTRLADREKLKKNQRCYLNLNCSYLRFL